jgi:hypothetical protein
MAGMLKHHPVPLCKVPSNGNVAVNGADKIVYCLFLLSRGVNFVVYKTLP